MQTYDVKEIKRMVCFVGGVKANFHNVTKLLIDGNWFRFVCDEGLILVNPVNVLYFQVDGETAT